MTCDASRSLAMERIDRAPTCGMLVLPMDGESTRGTCCGQRVHPRSPLANLNILRCARESSRADRGSTRDRWRGPCEPPSVERCAAQQNGGQDMKARWILGLGVGLA